MFMLMEYIDLFLAHVLIWRGLRVPDRTLMLSFDVCGGLKQLICGDVTLL